MPQSLHSINSQISQISLKSHVQKVAQNSSKSSKHGAGLDGFGSLRQAKFSQTCTDNHDFMMIDLQTYQKPDTEMMDDNAGPTTLISHLNDD